MQLDNTNLHRHAEYQSISIVSTRTPKVKQSRPRSITGRVIRLDWFGMQAELDLLEQFVRLQKKGQPFPPWRIEIAMACFRSHSYMGFPDYLQQPLAQLETNVKNSKPNDRHRLNSIMQVIFFFFFFYSSQEVIVLNNQKTASAIIKGTYVHTTLLKSVHY